MRGLCGIGAPRIATPRAGIVFPADVTRLTGMDPASPSFAAWHAAQLRKLVHLLAG